MRFLALSLYQHHNWQSRKSQVHPSLARGKRMWGQICAGVYIHYKEAEALRLYHLCFSKWWNWRVSACFIINAVLGDWLLKGICQENSVEGDRQISFLWNVCEALLRVMVFCLQTWCPVVPECFNSLGCHFTSLSSSKMEWWYRLALIEHFEICGQKMLPELDTNSKVCLSEARWLTRMVSK